jgi:uncharacterized protein involved in exopolysaccharide biosynthesis
MLPQVEIMPNQTQYNRVSTDLPPKRNSRRLVVFVITMLLSSALSLSYVYSRPALYRSFANLLTVAPTAIDQQSSEADIQHVAIQRQILTGQELLAETLARLKIALGEHYMTDSHARATELSITELRNMLTVQAIPETNLVELAAISYQADILAPLINSWIDVYLERRAEEIRLTTGVTIDALYKELSGLQAKIIIKRNELEHFREVNNITSLGRENIFENQSLARFKGLTKSLNDASEKAVQAKARLSAVKSAIAAGKIVVPKEDQRQMQTLGQHLQELREQLAEVEQRYTPSYLALNPTLTVLPQQIKELEQKIHQKRNYGKSIVLAQAEQDYAAAKQSFQVIKQQLATHKRNAREFSTKFSEHEALLSDMEGLELLQRTTQERLAQIEAKQAEKFPQVKVIERAFLPREPFSPNYQRDTIIAIVGSIFLSLFCVWLVDFLTRQEQHKPEISISGVNMYATPAPDLINNHQKVAEQLPHNQNQAIAYAQTKSLEHPIPQELTASDLNNLLDVADIKAKQLVALLLSGMSLTEVCSLNKEHIDFDAGTLAVIGENARTLSLNPALITLLKNNNPCPAWLKSQEVSAATLEAILFCTAVDAGLPNPQSITATSLTQTYAIYLVKQGMRLAELEKIIGYTEPQALLQYGHYSPEKRGLPMSEVNLFHPILARLSA